MYLVTFLIKTLTDLKDENSYVPPPPKSAAMLLGGVGFLFRQPRSDRTPSEKRMGLIVFFSS